MKTLMVCSALLLVINAAVADLNGSDDFDDNLIDTNKWASLVGSSLTETNSRLEYIGGAGEVVEGLEWIVNKGSYTNDWSVSIDVVISIDENSLTNQQIQFLLVAYWIDPFENNLSVEFEVGYDSEGYYPYRYIRTDVEHDGVVVLDEPITFSSESVRLQISFDASAKVLTSYYDTGGGMTVLTNYDVSAWGMADIDEFTIAMAFESADISPASGEVYGDNFLAVTLTNDILTADLNGSDDFNDNVIDTNNWEAVGAMAETNSRLEYVGGGANYADGYLAWIANQGSYTNDWYVSIDVVNAVDETSLTNQFVCYGLGVVPPSSGIYSLELRVGDNDGGANPYRHVMTAYDNGEIEVFQNPFPVLINSVRLLVAYDASAKILTSYCDSGGGMTVLTNYNVSGWGMANSDKFIIAVFGWSYNFSPASEEVYGDNFLAVTLPKNIMITNSIPTTSGVMLEWIGVTGWNSTVMYSTNLVTMTFADLSTPMPYPANSYTDLVHGAESECFYRIEIRP